MEVSKKLLLINEAMPQNIVYLDWSSFKIYLGTDQGILQQNEFYKKYRSGKKKNNSSNNKKSHLGFFLINCKSGVTLFLI